jgi:hypothetical protein
MAQWKALLAQQTQLLRIASGGHQQPCLHSSRMLRMIWFGFLSHSAAIMPAWLTSCTYQQAKQWRAWG